MSRADQLLQKQVECLWKLNVVPNSDSKRVLASTIFSMKNFKRCTKKLCKDKGFAERLSEHDLEDDNCWYLPHHLVSHPKKANKVRVVFDCAARYNGTSLNEQLLTGPDFLNYLFGILTRFRKGKVTPVADIESMYHQVLVDPHDWKYLKFCGGRPANLIFHVQSIV